MKVVFLTSGRFHVFYQVRELLRLGHDVRVYTLVPPWRARRFGIPRNRLIWMVPRIPFATAAYFSFLRLGKRSEAERVIATALDRKMAEIMPACDAFIPMSGMGLESLRIAKERGATRLLQRSSRHIESQARILAEISSDDSVAQWTIDRELAEYDETDFIFVLSRHCADSFVKRGFASERLVRIMPGVDLADFKPNAAPRNEYPTIIMTGNWSRRKGCDLLYQAWYDLRNSKFPTLKLQHVGSKGDLDLPIQEGFTHVDHVPQGQLSHYYSKAHVFCLASYEEGFAVVQMQALAAGLRIVCSDRAGGADLHELIEDKNRVSVFKSGDLEGLKNALSIAVAEAIECPESAELGRNVLSKITWETHAKNLEEFLMDHCPTHAQP